MYSDDEEFLNTPEITIYNDRNQKDYAIVRDNQFSGMEKDSTYPNVYSGEYPQDGLYRKKGDKFKGYCIAGGKDWYFKATHIEFYGVNTNQINSKQFGSIN
jgi:hypothetical protein